MLLEERLVQHAACEHVQVCLSKDEACMRVRPRQGAQIILGFAPLSMFSKNKTNGEYFCTKKGNYSLTKLLSHTSSYIFTGPIVIDVTFCKSFPFLSTGLPPVLGCAWVRTFQTPCFRLYCNLCLKITSRKPMTLFLESIRKEFLQNTRLEDI